MQSKQKAELNAWVDKHVTSIFTFLMYLVLNIAFIVGP